MGVSSGSRSLIGEALGWVGVLAVMALGIVHLDTVKGYMRHFVGLPHGEQLSVAEDRAASREPLASGGNYVRLKADHTGHYYATAQVNGRSIDVMVDTGATIVALTYEDAERAGIFVRSSDFTQQVGTANGMVAVAPVTLDSVSIGDITVRNVRAAVSQPGLLRTTLLGMSFIGHLRADIDKGVLTLRN